MKIVMCEDERIFTKQLADIIKKWSKEKNVFAEVFTYSSAEEFLHEWNSDEDYDIIFLDIVMGHISGMELAHKIRETNPDIPIVFVTNAKEHVMKGYTVSAMQYLLKPISENDCFDCLERVNQNGKTKKHFVFKDLEKTVRVPARDIIYISMYSHTATMATAAKKYEFRKTISQILEELDDRLFVKCHKSYVINMRYVEAVSLTYATMSNGKNIPLSKNIAGEINDLFAKYNLRKI